MVHVLATVSASRYCSPSVVLRDNLGGTIHTSVERPFGELRAVVVAPQKTGTHLVQELMLEARYRIVGSTRPSLRNLPAFTRAERLRMVEQVFGPERSDRLDQASDADFLAVSDAAWDALRWTWYRRFGQPVVNRYGADKLEPPADGADGRRLAGLPFADTPAGLCWIWHELDISTIDGQFVGEWSDEESPPLILNFRDPRDALISLIYFLEGGTGRGLGNFYERRAYNKVLGSLPTLADKISYALEDPYFPASKEFEKAYWLLSHPAVCKVRYEDLVGPSGGGSVAAQREAIDSVLRHLGDEKTDAAEVALRIYNPDSWSFRKGQVGGWRSGFSQRNIDQFHERYGVVLARYGYK